jgi:hypothetical protein
MGVSITETGVSITEISSFHLANENQSKPNWSIKFWEGKYISFTDYNNDGKLDVIREGHIEQVNKMYKNCNLYDNLPPSIPEQLITKTGCNKVEFSWKESSDDHSPTNTLFYEIYVGSIPGASDVASIHNSNYIQNNFYNLNSLQPGTYYWSVKAVDQAQTASAWAAEQSFTISGKPTTPVVSLIGNSLHSNVQSGNQWHDLNGPITGATAQDYTPTSNGTYYTLVTAAQCTSDTSNKIEVIVSGSNNPSDQTAFAVMPNPANKYLSVSSYFTGHNVSYKIADIHGREIHSGFFQDKATIQIESLSKGSYFITFESEKMKEVFKFLKE